MLTKLIASYKSLFFASLTDRKWIRIVDDVTKKRTADDQTLRRKTRAQPKSYAQRLHLNYLLSHGSLPKRHAVVAYTYYLGAGKILS